MRCENCGHEGGNGVLIDELRLREVPCPNCTEDYDGWYIKYIDKP